MTAHYQNVRFLAVAAMCPGLVALLAAALSIRSCAAADRVNGTDECQIIFYLPALFASRA